MVWVLAACAATFVLVLWLPLRLRVRVTGDGRPGWTAEAVGLGGVRMGWDKAGRYMAVGRLHCRLLTARVAAPIPEAEITLPEKFHAFIQRWQRLAREDAGAYVRLVRDIWAVVRFTARGDCRYSCDDPALTAWIQGAFYASGVHRLCPELSLEPDFIEAGWWGTVEFAVTLRPLYLVGSASRFFKVKLVRWISRKYRRGNAIWQV
ncbi:MAG: hypothetical protein P4N59_28905 [Negativicutes bacterium]|nr:hypothetical protein [Negativicutes bacterium]